MIRVRYTIESYRDIERILAYVEKNSPEYTSQVSERIEVAAKMLGVFPRAGRFDRESEVYERPIPSLPFLLIYTVSDSMVEIIAVFHTSRNPKGKRH